jgi:uncharacterized damage-inducible protein DinB
VKWVCLYEEATVAEREHGDNSVLVKLFEHNAWANVKLLDFCAGLSDEQLDASAVGGFGTIRNTLTHILGSEVSYVHRVNGKLPPTPLVRGQMPTFDVMREAARWNSDELLKLAKSARQESVVHESEGHEHAEYPLASLIVQAINHSTEHRTQIATIITQLGMQPPDMSGWAFMVETGQFREFDDRTTSG